MAQISEITIGDLLQHQRIDAEYFQPYFLGIEKKILQNSIHLKKYLVTLTDGKHGGVTLTENGVLFVRNSNNKEFIIDVSDPLFISEKESDETKRAEIVKGDILLTTIGTIGIASVVPDNFSRATINQNLVKIKVNGIEPDFLCAFLNSKFGRAQTTRFAAGNVQPIINYPNLKNILIPTVSSKKQAKIADKVEKGIQKHSFSKSLYSQAEQILLQELGLEDFTPEWVAGYETYFDNILEVARMDAEYFQPRYETVKEKIRAVDHDTLVNLVKPLKKGIEVGSEAYTDEGIPFLRVSNIEKLHIDNSSEQYIEAELYEELKDKFCPKKGEILLSKDGTPGIAYHLTEDVKTIISGGIVRLKTIEIEPEYLTLVLNSLIVQAQIEQDAGGALIKHWRPDQIKTTLIPILPKMVREKIVVMVQESFSALLESRQLLEQAKREVEEMIESKA